MSPYYITHKLFYRWEKLRKLFFTTNFTNYSVGIRI